jgi:3-hydroxyacyl-[acyl-carrier-protein] dehydratase
MLKDTLFKILVSGHTENSITATLEIYKNSKIFSGHFPGQPVLPGACMLQIIKEVAENTLDKSLRLKRADSIKFLAVIDPGINNILQLTLSYRLTDHQTIHITAGLATGTVTCFKFKGSFIAG